LVLLEERAGEHVAQEQDDAEDLVGLDSAGDDPLRQVARVVLEGLDGARLEHFDVVVVDRRRFGEDLVRRQGGEQPRLRDTARPLLPQLGPVGAEMRHELS
jgi:hypothetical protein